MLQFAFSTPPHPLLATIDLSTVVGAGVIVGLSILGFFGLVKSLLYICRPNEVLIFTGHKRAHKGVDLGPLIIMPRGVDADVDSYPGIGKGSAWRIPLLERVDRMDCTTLSTDVKVQNAYSRGNIPLRIHAIANVKIHSNPQLLRNAVERFLGRSGAEIRLVAQQVLEGALREVLAQMTPEEVNEDRLQFADKLARSAQDDFDKLGLQLDTLKIQSVSDETGYLDSLGRPRVARALRDAENAENQAEQEVTQVNAEAESKAEVARAEAELVIVKARNELTKVEAELDGEARAIEEEALAAAKTERAQAELELQRVRAMLEEKRLLADVIIPAEIAKKAAAIKAQGDAAPTVEQGAAAVEVLRVQSEAWASMGADAQQIWVIQNLEDIVGKVVENVQGLQVDMVSVLDRGDGEGLASYAASFPQSVAAILRSLSEVTGVNVPEVLHRQLATNPGQTSTGAMASMLSAGSSRPRVSPPSAPRPDQGAR